MGQALGRDMGRDLAAAVSSRIPMGRAGLVAVFSRTPILRADLVAMFSQTLIHREWALDQDRTAACLRTLIRLRWAEAGTQAAAVDSGTLGAAVAILEAAGTLEVAAWATFDSNWRLSSCRVGPMSPWELDAYCETLFV